MIKTLLILNLILILVILIGGIKYKNKVDKSLDLILGYELYTFTPPSKTRFHKIEKFIIRHTLAEEKKIMYLKDRDHSYVKLIDMVVWNQNVLLQIIDELDVNNKIPIEVKNKIVKGDLK